MILSAAKRVPRGAAYFEIQEQIDGLWVTIQAGATGTDRLVTARYRPVGTDVRFVWISAANGVLSTEPV